MRKSALLYISCFIVLASAILYSCGRTSGIDNNNVIQTPFSLYFSDNSGAVYYTNDGRNYDGFVYPPDGKYANALTICNNNVLMAKNWLYFSNNNGKNFNKTYDSISHHVKIVNGRFVELNQSKLVNVPTWDNRVYCMDSTPNFARNWLGLMYSDQSGNPKTWVMDGAYDTDGVGHVPVRMKSVTMLTNGTLCGLAYSGPADNDNNIHHRNFTKAGKDENVYTNRWKEVTANPDGISYIYFGNTGGTPLPPHGSVTDIGYFTLGHFNNQLIAIDQSGLCGAWYSDDMGKNWAKHSGLPANTPLLCIEAPFEEVCLIGTESKGLYILNVHTGVWEPNNQGLGTNITVRNIAAKKNVYKNGVTKKFIYLATDQGIYESADAGRNWTRTIPGNFVCVN